MPHTIRNIKQPKTRLYMRLNHSANNYGDSFGISTHLSTGQATNPELSHNCTGEQSGLVTVCKRC